MPTRVFIEGTSTYVDCQVGGIHRVVRKIVDEMPALHQEFDVESAPVVLSGGRLRAAGAFVDGPPPATWTTRLVRTCGRAAGRLHASHSVAWNDTDVLLLLDASWGKRIWPAVRKAKARGVAVGVMIHDLIPVHYPQFFPAKLPKMFRKWLDGAVAHADFFIGNSQTTIRDLRQYIQQDRFPRQQACIPMDSFSLGADLPNARSDTIVRPTIRSFFTESTAPYLLVSTIEPRKNHTYLLNAFDRIWQKSPATKLGIVGKVGWQCHDVVSRIRSHPQFGKSLMMYHDVTDAELQFCYRHAKAFIFPSIVEGFGLPIVEALNHGLRVLAADTPIHREVGGDYCQYFDLGDVSSLIAKIINREPSTRHSDSPRFRTVTWEESCRELLTKCLEMSGANRAISETDCRARISA